MTWKSLSKREYDHYWLWGGLVRRDQGVSGNRPCIMGGLYLRAERLWIGGERLMVLWCCVIGVCVVDTHVHPLRLFTVKRAGNESCHIHIFCILSVTAVSVCHTSVGLQ